MSATATIFAIITLILIALGCSEGLTEREVRQIVHEYSIPGPQGDKGYVQGLRAQRVTRAT